MADADEDVAAHGGPSADGIDLSDETQDFRFLQSLASEDAKIPKRGEKDFEPHSTALQSNALAASRQAMHNALAFQRVHPPNRTTLATYHPESNMAYTYKPHGPMFTKMGQIFSAKDDPIGNDERRGQRMWLLPEEVIFLTERGTIDVRWPPRDGQNESEGLPMSLQGAYAVCMGDEEAHGGKLTFVRYSVFSGLKRAGYVVQRAPSWNSSGPTPAPECSPLSTQDLRTWRTGLGLAKLWKKLFDQQDHRSNDHQSQGPVVRPGVYRCYADIYRQLAMIDFHDPSLTFRYPSCDIDNALHVTYHVWKPNSPFTKKNPGPPDFRIAVIDGRSSSLPTLEQLSALMDTVPYAPPKEGFNLYQKLKFGYKNVILAVVDQGVTSYLRIADAAFGKEKLYDRSGPMRGGKGGGRGGRGGSRGGRGARGR
ncbi:hypothetical protein EJ03DRAFT_278471 [Teratosphaeria nubilosa]|uniref:tRNA-splicing endonuclease subunit Sen54 N-terminal domain-containing protein n=1 Tax=Teratosphaeria nubilosa TaxID=161662 RepID=A0A6G1L079_9PEZI|nr:hypothetical protein EJ03DRAFT_278471 [Teratosphaeria nubilosa]